MPQNTLLQITCPDLERTRAKLALLNGEAPKAIARGMRAWAEETLTDAKRRTPVDTGALRASEHVSQEVNGPVSRTTLGAGGPSAPYAVLVHENLKATHPSGEAKFMENAVNERLGRLDAAIADEFDKALARAMKS